MAIKDLSANEKTVFHALVRHTSLNDRELSEKVGVKLSTVTAIKNRLKSRGYFMTVRVPQLQHLGCEMLSVNYARLNASIPQNKRLEVGRSLLADFPEIFYLASDERAGFAFSLNRNYSAAKSNTERFFRVYSESEFLLTEGYEAIHFPFTQSRISNFFDCAQLLARDFGITEREERRPARDERSDYARQASGVELSRIEKKVYRGLIANPDMHDSSVAKQIDVTRQTITKMRKHFEALELIRTVRIPNLDMLGYEVMVLLHQRYRPSQTLDVRSAQEEAFYNKMPVVFRAAADMEALELLAFHNFKEQVEAMVAMARFNREQRFVAREPEGFTFALKDLFPIKNHIYDRAVDRVLLPDLA
jgi:DNA-binding MarR family transcriptional regulator